MNSFTISVAVDGSTYTGTGTSKKQAKTFCAEAALRGCGLWNDDDEQLKASMSSFCVHFRAFVQELEASFLIYF